ncbi:MAG TPA: hypothetical protein VIL49_08940, partial [Capillimicrobium sp.]
NGCVRIAGVGADVSVKPTRPGHGMLIDGRGLAMIPRGFNSEPELAGRRSDFRLTLVRGGTHIKLKGRSRITLDGLDEGPNRIRMAKRSRCTSFPEAALNLTGASAEPVRPDGTVYGYADTHLHVTADMRAGGRVISGRAFHRYGLPRALGRDDLVHGSEGASDFTGNLLRDGVPFGEHDTAGYPSFSGWPTHDTNTHQQTYYRWLERSWRSGLRLIVAHTVEDEQICDIQPHTVTPCDETAAARGQIERLRELEAYVDAQHGRPGQGWFRLVRSSGEARRVIAQGKLAVVIGLESSFPLGCRAEGDGQCTTADVDRRLDELHAMGVRALFIAHWADNGFAGAGLQSGVKGKFINAMHRLETGRWFDVEACPTGVKGEVVESLSDLEIDVVSQFFPATAQLKGVERPTYPAGPQCNPRGLTPLGEHLVRRMAEKGMLIEADHLSHAAREDLLDLAEELEVPVVSGHNGTGGEWTEAQLTRMTKLGGVTAQTAEPAAQMAQQLAARTRYRDDGRFFGVAIGTDTGGFASLPGPAEDAAADPLRYPFRLDGSGPRFARQRTGERTFDLNRDGMAHYGLLPDLLADMERRPQGRQAVDLLFRSAEAYLRMWEAAER